jgi:hypothetical protein
MIKPAASLLLLTLALAGCQSAKAPLDYTPTLPRLFLETSDPEATSVALPQSGVRVAINPKPVFTEGDIVNVELVQVDLGKCLMLQLSPAAARELYRVSASNQGRRLLLMLNQVPIGARRIDGPLADGNVLMFVEVPDVALPVLVTNLKKTTAELQRTMARK